MSKERSSVTYEEERLYFFVDQVSLAQKKYDRLYKTFKDAPYLSEGARFLSDAGRELQFYKDVVEMLDKGYRKQSNLIEEFIHRAIDLSVCKDNGDGTERLFVSTENLRKIAQVMKGGASL